MSTTNSPLVQDLRLKIMKESGYMMGENSSTRGVKIIYVSFVRDPALVKC